MVIMYNLLEKFNNLLLKLKKSRIYCLNDSHVGINIGCEHNTPSNYLGIDGSPLIWFVKNKYFPRFLKKMLFYRTCTSNHLTFEEFDDKLCRIHVVHHNLIHGIPFRDGSIRNIFSSHFLEHLTGEQSVKLLKECKRVLKSGGVLRIVVPCLDNEVAEMKRIISQYEKDGQVGALQKYLTTDMQTRGSFGLHKKMYNFDELKKTLGLAGFDRVKRKKRGQGKIENVSDLDIRGGLIVEAYKN